MDSLSWSIYVWGMSAIVLTMPTALVAVWIMCRAPSKPRRTLHAAGAGAPPSTALPDAA